MMTFRKIQERELRALESRALDRPCYRSMAAVAEYASANGLEVSLEAGAWSVCTVPGDDERASHIEVVSPHWDRWCF